jgi:hypothetical protein
MLGVSGREHPIDILAERTLDTSLDEELYENQ